jgi:D-alanine transaminase
MGYRSNMPAIACVNGQFSPIETAVISVEDRGFQLGDGVYEVLRTYRGRPFAMEEHLRRLFRSLEAIEIEHRFTPAELERLIRDGIQRGGFAESLVYLQITRGAAKRAKEFLPGVSPTLVLTVRELEAPSAALRAGGARLMTAKDIRWQRCDIKSVCLLANVLTFHRAKAAGFNEAVFVEEDEAVAECCSANLFIVQHGQVATPPKTARILGGITREAVIALARQHRVPLEERRVQLAELRAADEVFLTSTTVEILPVVQVDGQAIGAGKPGPVTEKLQELFQNSVA